MDNAQARDLYEELLERSPTARALVARIEQSDVIVYVRHRSFTSTTLDGRTGFVQSGQPTRTLVIELANARPWLDQLTTLAHELQHAVEIAEAPAVAGPAAMAEYFSRIGTRVTNNDSVASYETARAQEIAVQVKRELRQFTARSSYD